jgi:hypothetical protein
VIDEKGRTVDAGPAPYLDLRPLKPDETEAAHKLLDAGWLKGDIEKMAMHFAIAQLVPEHLRETRERRLAEINRVESEVRARLKREINYWDGRAEEQGSKAALSGRRVGRGPSPWIRPHFPPFPVCTAKATLSPISGDWGSKATHVGQSPSRRADLPARVTELGKRMRARAAHCCTRRRAALEAVVVGGTESGHRSIAVGQTLRFPESIGPRQRPQQTW